MKVFKLIKHPKVKLLAAVEEESHPINSSFEGGSKLEGWTKIEVETLYKRVYSDFPHYVIGQPVVSERIKLMMEKDHILLNKVEFLPLCNEDKDIFMINVTNVLDCVDYPRSDIRRFKDGSWMSFENLVFDKAKIPENTYIFKIKETAAVEVFITDKFKDWVEKNKLKGLDFSVVYDLEKTEGEEQEQRIAYESVLEQIEQNKGEEFSYDEARELIRKGYSMASGAYKMQLDDQGRFWLGDLTKALKYQWIMPVFIPPVLLLLKMHKIEPSIIEE